MNFYVLISGILRILKSIQCLYAFFIKTSKVFMRLDVPFLSFPASKSSNCILFSTKYYYLLTMKITPDVYNSLLLVHAVQSLRSSPQFKEYCNEIDDFSLIILRFLFFQTKLVFIF